MHRGYIALYRKIQDHPFYTENRVFSKYEAWIDILMEVQHKFEETETVIGMNVITCGHGQAIKSLRTWAKRWGWTAKKVSRFFILLEKMNQIRHENVTVTTRITVLNYSKYDIKCDTDVTDVSHNGNSPDTQMKHDRPTDNNVKKEKNENNISVPLKDGTFFILDNEYLKVLKDTYKNIDTGIELNKLIAWNISNPSKQKTKKGIKRHINTWISSANDKVKPASSTDISTESWF